MQIRPTAVAGFFYPDDPQQLRAIVTGFLEDARGGAQAHPRGVAPDSVQGVIAPHAGYIYSGLTAGSAYVQLEPLADRVRHVVIVGPTHRVGIHGIALPDADAMATPLGLVPLWAEGVSRALACPRVEVSEAVHAQEHSLEVQLPFLQMTLPDVDVLPLAAGWVEPQDVALVLSDVADPADTAIIISSDLSHYHPYAEARRIDQETVRQILRRDPLVSHDQACGATGINALTLVSNQRGLHPVLIGMCTSGDTAGDKKAVVGYAAFGFYATSLDEEEEDQ
ncbi:MAG: AmmeMemoRadiSam system protein B [Propionibacteriaceae bacterium]|nr:AmmeMemoRadiSam system protein B [Propionibacteriaceae bacterium]